ncbi:MAG: 7-cyano-7-deazaguanine synthase QueC [Candidatus Thermoplasmatota archaeon]
MKRAVALLSGGVDSAVAAALARSEGYELICLTLDYGQKHRREVEAARNLSRALEALEHMVLSIDLGRIASSALTDPGREMPDGLEEKIPSTYVPARNMILLSIAMALAESRDAEAVVIGATAVDYAGYPDCRSEFLAVFERAGALGTRRGAEGAPVRILAPLVNMTKAEIIRKGAEMGVPFEHTWSCYRGGERACGRCASCIYRLKGFREAGLEDPLEYLSA